MRIFKTQEDFDVLCRAGTLPVALLDQIEDYFLQLRDELEYVRIELEFDKSLRQCLVIAAPSTDKVDGAYSLSRHRYPSPFTIVI